MRTHVSFAAVLALGALASGCIVEARSGNGASNPNYHHIGNANDGPQVGPNHPPPPPNNPQPPPPPVNNTMPQSPAPNCPQNTHVENAVCVPNPGSASAGFKYPSIGVFAGDFGRIAPAGAITGTLYYIDDQTTKSMPDLSKLTPRGTLYMDHFAIHERDANTINLVVSNRQLWFALRYNASFTVAQAGSYQFDLVSDDGAILYIDGKAIVNNDGIHIPRDQFATVPLTAGSHTIQVDYFKGGPWVVALEVFVTPPGKPRQYWAHSM